MMYVKYIHRSCASAVCTYTHQVRSAFVYAARMFSIQPLPSSFTSRTGAQHGQRLELPPLGRQRPLSSPTRDSRFITHHTRVSKRLSFLSPRLPTTQSPFPLNMAWFTRRLDWVGLLLHSSCTPVRMRKLRGVIKGNTTRHRLSGPGHSSPAKNTCWTGRNCN